MVKSAGKMKKVGTKVQVWHEHALHTAGGLQRSDLIKNKHGKIVSKRQHAAGLQNAKNLKQWLWKPRGSSKSASMRRSPKRRSPKRRSPKRRSPTRKSARIAGQK